MVALKKQTNPQRVILIMAMFLKIKTATLIKRKLLPTIFEWSLKQLYAVLCCFLFCFLLLGPLYGCAVQLPVLSMCFSPFFLFFLTGSNRGTYQEREQIVWLMIYLRIYIFWEAPFHFSARCFTLLGFRHSISFPAEFLL